MYKKVFLDVNVIADIYDETRPFHKQSDKTIEIFLNSLPSSSLGVR